MKLPLATVLSLSLLTPLAAAPTPNSQTMTITRSGTQPSRKGPVENFTGSVTVTPLFSANAPARAAAGSVTFEPCARSAWHSHPMGQTLVVTDGTGLVQQWGGPIEIIREGDVVWTPPNQKHWHGATATTSMTHTAIQEQLEGRNVTWMEKVTDAEYAKQPSLLPAVQNMPNQPSAAQKLMGDVAPRLADLTDKVLFGDVWERPDLSKRDRSLVTISALIALNRPDQLRSHLARARDNGVTETEIVETITHLAFYSGWPNAVTAVSVAREVFQQK